MNMDSSGLASHGSFTDFLATHKGIAIGGGVILLLVVAGVAMRSRNSQALPASATADLSGLSGGKIYVPTSTNFTTENIKYGPLSNNPNLVTVTNSPINSNNPTTTTSTSTSTTSTSTGGGHTTGGGSRVPPPPTPVPVTNKRLIWDARYSIRGGETLSSIAAALTRTLRASGMPGSMSVTWHDLYAHNTDLINRTAQAHGFRSDYWNWIFPGESITVPRWG